MAVYKIPQDVEADDKFVGPLSFKQFIFVGIAVIGLYLSFLSYTKGLWPALIFFAPIIIACGFLGYPWGRDQPTEIWLAARIRFLIKPRMRIWNQSGVKELVTITAPKKIIKTYTDGLSQIDVSSRLTGLATLLDSRGWAVKNAGSNVYASPLTNQGDTSDRLLDVSSMPRQVTETFSAAADVLDESINSTALNFDHLIKSSETKHRQEIINQLQNARQVPVPTAQPPAQAADFWFLQNQNQGGAQQSAPQQTTMQPPNYASFQTPTVVAPLTPAMVYDDPQTTMQTPLDPGQQDAEAALLEKLHRQQQQGSVQHSHLKTILPIAEQQRIAKEQQKYAQQLAAQNASYPTATLAPPQQVTPPVNPAIISLANNDDLNIATLARQARIKQQLSDDGEVVVSLH